MSPPELADPSRSAPLVVLLDDTRAADAGISGAKSANLAIARQRGLTTLPGLAVTTHAHALLLAHEESEAGLPTELQKALREPWGAITADGERSLVVRSSSTIEDVGESSMAGQFRSILDVEGWPAFLNAVADVFASARTTPGAQAGSGIPLPMAVLVQPMLDATVGGVMFGVDPVTGDVGTVVVEAVVGGPDKLVSGRSTAQRYVLDHKARLRTIDAVPRPHWPRHAPELLLTGSQLKQLHELAQRAERTYGRPQDIEWAFDAEGSLWLLQSRPVTAVAGTVEGPVLGAGPVAETFPDALRPLEQQMWVEPLRDGVVAALRKTGAIRASTSSTDLVRVVAGHVVVDLEAFGYLKHRSPLGLLDPRPPLHRLGLAWKVGRLRADLSDRATDRTRETDEWLAQVPSLAGATDDALLALIDESRTRLVDVHRDEVLVGTLSVSSSRTAAADALSRLSIGRARGLTDEQIIATDPVTLALVPARVGAVTALPATRGPGEARSVSGSSELSAREALRLRARWLQELQARTAAELGRRWVEAGVLGAADDIALLDLDELRAVQSGAPLPEDLATRADTAASDAAAAPLPSQFRLAGDGSVVPASRRGARRAGGVGAGGGRGSGHVSHGDALHPPCAGDVLVVRDLSPALAPFLPGLAGVVSESGSTLSHLAILAREYGVPTVVAAHDALQRFPEGTRLLVDGRTGELSVLEEDT